MAGPSVLAGFKLQPVYGMKMRQRTVMQKPSLIGAESVLAAFRQSHRPQAKKTRSPVAKTSAMAPWRVVRSVWMSVMQKESSAPCAVYISCTGVITCRNRRILYRRNWTSSTLGFDLTLKLPMCWSRCRIKFLLHPMADLILRLMITLGHLRPNLSPF